MSVLCPLTDITQGSGETKIAAATGRLLFSTLPALASGMGESAVSVMASKIALNNLCLPYEEMSAKYAQIPNRKFSLRAEVSHDKLIPHKNAGLSRDLKAAYGKARSREVLVRRSIG